jgi:hypothetical protein
MHKDISKIAQKQAQLKNLTKSQIETFDYLLSKCSANDLLKKSSSNVLVNISQQCIARSLGYCRKTISRAISELVAFGFITAEYVHRKTSMYYISSIVGVIATDMQDRANIAKILPAIRTYMWYLTCKSFNIVAKPLCELQPEENKASQKTQNVPPYIEALENNLVISKDCKFVARAKSAVSQLVKKTTVAMTNFKDRFKNKSSKELKIQEKGVAIMKEHSIPFISPLMKSITNYLKLTKHGQIRLLIYDEKSLQSAFDSIDRAMRSQDPFAFFVEHCNGYSFQHKLPVKEELYETMMTRYEIKRDSAFVAKKIEEPKKISVAKAVDDTLSREVTVEEKIKFLKDKEDGRMAKGWQYDWPGMNA